MRRFWLALVALTVLFAGYSFGQGPLTTALNLRVRTDSNGSLYVYGVAAGAQGPLTNLGNIMLRTYAPGSLAVTVAGGTITPDKTCWGGTTQDSYIVEVGANNPGAYTGGTSCAGGTLRWDWNGTRVLFAVPINTGTAVATTSMTTPTVIVGTGSIDTSGAELRMLNSAASNFYPVRAGSLNLTTASGGTGNLILGAKITNYTGVNTAGQGVPSLFGYGDVAAATNPGTASIAAYTVGAADGTFEVSCNILVTTSTTHSFSCDTTYTDEGNTARTLVLPVEQLSGTFATSGLITNATGAGPYESAVLTIRAKASTVITIRTSAGGTFTNVVYNARGVIKQVG